MVEPGVQHDRRAGTGTTGSAEDGGKTLQEMADQLRIVRRDLDHFSHSITHDLRTPLGQIDGFAYLLGLEYGSALDDKGHGYLERIRGASRQMLGLIDELWHLNRIARAEVQPRELDLGDMARALAVDSGSTGAPRTIAYDIAPDLVAFADADLTRLALDSLLRNALGYTACREQARIEFASCMTEHGRTFFIRDDGAGFDLGDDLFTRLQRLHAVAGFEGAGLRYAKAERAIERQGGRIWADSAAGQGATFYFTLERAR